MIYYASENVAIPNLHRYKIKGWLRRVALSYQKKVGDLTYIFCDDEKILEVNRQFLKHDYYTDVITFDYSEGDTISGDIFISIDTVRSNAEERNIPFMSELHRVIIHGILHLCGINDKGPGEREVMESSENRALALLPELGINIE
jgi:rRNA maturation RNase YbeY